MEETYIQDYASFLWVMDVLKDVCIHKHWSRNAMHIMPKSRKLRVIIYDSIECAEASNCYLYNSVCFIKHLI